jgi:hypothetical protein
MKDRPWREDLRKYGVHISVSRSSRCGKCGDRVSDDTISHGSFSGGGMCKGKPRGPWRYHSAVYQGGSAVDPSTLPADVAERLSAMGKEARKTRKSIHENI